MRSLKAKHDDLPATGEEELLEWYGLTPAERFAESQRLWATFFLLGGKCEPEPDSQSPFYFPPEEGLGAPHGRLYGAAEFSRDIYLGVAVGSENLARLRAALDELRAEPVFFPALSAAVLRRGHACHFRCPTPALHGFRIDVMSKLKGVDPFARLWRRRVELEVPGVGQVAVMALRDLVRATKTQRDKDWSMVGA